VSELIELEPVETGPTPEHGGPLLEIEGLRVTFPTEEGEVQAVRGVDLTVYPNETLGIVGESGSGKSVTMLAMMGLLPKTARIEGSARYRGEELMTRERRIRRYRGGRIAMIFQDPLTALNPVHRVGDQISEAILAHKSSLGRDGARDRAIEMLDLVGIPQPKTRSRQFPHEFSGGMRQRAMIAMAIANDPEVLIADEPTTALDVTVQAQILEVIQDVQRETEAAVVFITHDLGVIARLATRVQVMYAGKAVELGSVDDIFADPRHPYTRGLLDSLPRLDAEGHERLRPIPGAPPSMVSPPSGCAFHPRCPMAQDVCSVEVPALRFIEGTQSSACHFAEEVGRTDR
jgi:oligopeptide/dipeptide ABC transporter ATP-binding protein